MSGLMDKPVLVLNATYEPIQIAAARDAVKLLVKRDREGNLIAVSVVDNQDHQIHAGMYLPSVVRLCRFRKVPFIRTKPKARNIFLRDGYQCQYCGGYFKARDLTLDHVLPRSRGGDDTWDNLVSCCGPCNHRKADRTPQEAGMTLLRIPRVSTIHTSRHLMRLQAAHLPEWRKYLYYD